MKKLGFIIPIMILVAVIAMWMLKKDYSEIQLLTRLLISVGAALLSGIISYFLMGRDSDEVRN
ncbi:histidine kinase [Bacillus sp. CGMCC 1.16607]|uniref:histidine kinase n=1 Tax=Bacillus sp. CGMCC 1.16607 TaxID=3351842 RepID=UPI00362F0270